MATPPVRIRTAWESDAPGPLELLVLQPTPFCNLDCSYCYLPDRNSTRQMSIETLEAALRWVFDSGLVRQPFTVLWHAGEPLVVSPAFYEEALALVQQYNSPGVHVSHSIQTNGTLIDPDWCAFFKHHDILLGVSVDGPAFLHDRVRTTRQGRGTLARVLQGIELLNEHDVPFHVITVLTDYALDYPDELFDFYTSHGIVQVAFNVEEVEGPHTTSSLRRPTSPARYANFLNRFFDLAEQAGWPLRVRELDGMLGAIRYRGDLTRTPPQEANPFAIVSVDCAGDYTTFSPELLGLTGAPYGSFTLGNVATTPLDDAIRSARFQAMAGDVARGVRRCRTTCPYFDVCGGVAPANKYFENGSFDSTETLYCKLTRQVVLDVVLSRLESASGPAGLAEESGGRPCHSSPDSC